MYTVDDPIFEAIYEELNGNIYATKRILRAIMGVKNHDDKIDFATALITAGSFDNEAERQARWKADQQRMAKNRMSRDMRNMAVTKWVMANVKSGMMVRMSGTKDGSGWRKVIRWKTDVGEVLECQKLTKSRVPTGEKYPNGIIKRKTVWIEEPYITTHGPEKVMAVDLDNAWRNVVDLIKEEKKHGKPKT